MDGRYRGQSPITLSLSPGIDYEIGMSKAGYGVTSRNLRLESAASDAITVDLSARLGTVTVSVQPQDATVYVDGRADVYGDDFLTYYRRTFDLTSRWRQPLDEYNVDFVLIENAFVDALRGGASISVGVARGHGLPLGGHFLIA